MDKQLFEFHAVLILDRVTDSRDVYRQGVILATDEKDAEERLKAYLESHPSDFSLSSVCFEPRPSGVYFA